MKESLLSRFIESLELFEDLLHAETQAVAVKQLDTIETVLEKKEIALTQMLELKGQFDAAGEKSVEVDELVQRVLTLQERNTFSFKKLFSKINSEPDDSSKKSSKEKRLRDAYLGSNGSRLRLPER